MNRLICMIVLSTQLYCRSFRYHSFRPLSLSLKMISNRVQKTENPYIEDVLDKYCGLPNITNLALGSSHWTPPTFAQTNLQQDIFARDSHRYGNILGMPELRNKLKTILSHRALDIENIDIAITAGANQAFTNVALTLCDHGDNAIIVAPYYFSHLMSLQLSQVNISICPFQRDTLQPNWDELKLLFETLRPKMVSECFHAVYFYFYEVFPITDCCDEPK